MQNVKKYFGLQLVILVYVASTIASKYASSEEFLTFKFIFYYGLVVFILFVYAILWQQVLKRFSLTIAYLNKATAIVWSMIIGYFLFNEGVSINNLIGALVVIVGIVIMVKGEQTNE